MPLSPAASSLADRPSTMKLFEKFRWLPMEIPCPGTADVSANNCVLPVLVGDTPGTSSARSRKFRPFSGTVCTSACETVPAIWLRAASSTVASAETVTLVSMPATESLTGSSNADPTVTVTLCDASANPAQPHDDFVASDSQIRKAESSLLVGDGLAREICLDLPRRHTCSRHNGALRIGDTPADGAVVDRLLRRRACLQPRRRTWRTGRRFPRISWDPPPYWPT